MNNKLRFGVIPSGRVRDIKLSVESAATTLKTVDWSTVIIPSDYQDEGSCVMRATMNLAEALIRIRDGVTAFLLGEQLDAASGYWLARKRFYNDQADEGLQLDMGLKVAIEDMGIFPPGTKIVEIEPTLPAIVAALHKTPLIQAHLVGNNWKSENVRTDNGFIRFKEVNPATALGGHATLMSSFLRPDGIDHLGFQNTWPDWGWMSQGIMSWDTWWAGYRWMMDGPLTVELPVEWENWQGWRKWVIKT